MKLLDFMDKADPSKKRLIRDDQVYDVLFSLDYLLEMEENKTNSNLLKVKLYSLFENSQEFNWKNDINTRIFVL